MADPMEEDDSFNQPVLGSISYRPQPPVLTRSRKEEEEPDSDSDAKSTDSFDNFEPTQTTNSGSIKSSAGSSQSNEIKAPPPPIPTPSFRGPSSSNYQFSQQQNIALPATRPPPQVHHTKPQPPPLRRSEYSNTPPQMTQKDPVRPTKPPIGVHSAVTMTKTLEISKTSMMMTQKLSNCSQSTPASPNSLARHRSMNSGLRNAIPSNRGADLFEPRSSPSDRPTTPGDLHMLRDQLDNEKKKVLRLQADFQKDSKKKEEEHQRLLAAKDEVISQQKRDLEVLKASMNCQKKDGSGPSSSAPTASSTSSSIPLKVGPSRPVFHSTPSTSDVKKVKPKIPGESRAKTPRRLSAFRHPIKEEEDDTFQLNASFEPSATSTPKMTGIPRSGLRRPLDLGGFFDDDENILGAPTPKRKPVFVEQRRRRTRKEVEEEIRKIRDGMPEDLPKPAEIPPKNPNPRKRPVKTDTENDQWLDKILTRKMRLLDFRKKSPLVPERQMTSRVKNRILKGAELRPVIEKKCAHCQMPRESSTENSKLEVEKEEKEWERQEVQRRELLKKEAEELRSLHYTTFIHSINRRGMDELSGSTRRNEDAEQLYQTRIQGIKIRNLDEIREEKRQEWRRQIADRLEEDGEMNACLEIREVGRNEDFIWTEDEGEGEEAFPQPYHHRKSSLCSDCRHHQKRQRRMAKREWEKQRIKTDCLREYGIERREELRNMSILTKSRLEAADQSLFRATEASSFGAFQCMDTGEHEEEEEDAFF